MCELGKVIFVRYFQTIIIFFAVRWCKVPLCISANPQFLLEERSQQMCDEYWQNAQSGAMQLYVALAPFLTLIITYVYCTRGMYFTKNNATFLPNKQNWCGEKCLRKICIFQKALFPRTFCLWKIDIREREKAQKWNKAVKQQQGVLVALSWGKKKKKICCFALPSPFACHPRSKHFFHKCVRVGW